MKKSPKVLPFVKEHIQRMVFQPQQAWLRDEVEKNPDFAKNLEENCHVFSVEYEDEILFIGGCTEIHRGVGEVWAIFSPEGVRKQGRFITRGSRDFLNMLQSEYKFHRLYTTIDLEFFQGHRWVKILGFTKESILKKYRSNQEDSALYVRL